MMMMLLLVMLLVMLPVMLLVMLLVMMMMSYIHIRIVLIHRSLMKFIPIRVMHLISLQHYLTIQYQWQVQVIRIYSIYSLIS
ncbi:hypothetical protein BDF22DRAFT_692531 [Syncephalis plumigaleata]|nr:hypothetical protein BDF22DRAFT_692531 [Syncephalis plumigaleata]